MAGLGALAPDAGAATLAYVTAPALPTLPGVTLNGRAQTVSARMNHVSVIDTNSVGPGWNITINGNAGATKSPVFAQYCPNTTCGTDPMGYVASGRSLVANSLSLDSTGVTWSGGSGSAPSMLCASGCSIDSRGAVRVASAPSGGGTGVWSTSTFGASSVTLSVPTTLRALPAGEVYHLDVVWTLTSGP